MSSTTRTLGHDGCSRYWFWLRLLPSKLFVSVIEQSRELDAMAKRGWSLPEHQCRRISRLYTDISNPGPYRHPTLPSSLNAGKQSRQQHTSFSSHIENFSLLPFYFLMRPFWQNHAFDSVNHYFCSLDGVYNFKRSDCAVDSGDV